jgi:hypothetical protein
VGVPLMTALIKCKCASSPAPLPPMDSRAFETHLDAIVRAVVDPGLATAVRQLQYVYALASDWENALTSAEANQDVNGGRLTVHVSEGLHLAGRTSTPNPAPRSWQLNGNLMICWHCQGPLKDRFGVPGTDRYFCSLRYGCRIGRAVGV